MLYQEGNHQAFQVLYDRHKGKVYGYLQKRLTDRDAVDDLFQSIFTKLHKSRQQYGAKFPFVKWLYTICRSELIDHLRKPRPKEAPLVEVETAIATVTQSFDIAGEDLLSDKEKKALQLRYESDQEFHAIAHALETSESKARKIISRGIQKLRKKYGGKA